ncbi:hypothetical protein EGW08_022005 [Elysia chlorotica]|uniref:Corticotropin-releasing factor domain-containing protein n=1 Tax=Elysia chlorotica TaxID=188477 RepID=A0A433SM33_ELYCH|nr:hypothetical protein EGW08_022005 [Elysia chlorotica]
MAAASRYCTLAGLSLLLLAMTELAALASSFRLQDDENQSDSASPYSQALGGDIGSTLHLLDYLLARTDGSPQDSDKHPSSPAMKGEDVSETGSESPKDLLETFSDWSQDESRQHIMAALLQRIQLNTLLESVASRQRHAGDNMAAAEDRETAGFLKGRPASSSAVNAKIDDVIPTAIKAKRGRSGMYGAMPPTNELCRMLNMRCY